MLLRPRRPEHVGAQDDAVVHGYRRVPIDLHAAGAATRLVHVTPPMDLCLRARHRHRQETRPAQLSPQKRPLAPITTTIRPSGRLTAMIWRMRLRRPPAFGQSAASTARLNASHGPWNSQRNNAIITQPIACMRWTCTPTPAKPPNVLNTIQ